MTTTTTPTIVLLWRAHKHHQANVSLAAAHLRLERLLGFTVTPTDLVHEHVLIDDETIDLDQFETVEPSPALVELFARPQRITV